jgi:competence protein ComEA
MPQEGEHPSLSVVWQVYHVPLLLGAVSLLFIVLSITIFIKSYQDVAPIEFRDGTAAASGAGELSSEKTILVDIEGGIVSPGVYRVSSGARIHELFTLAGGFAPDADIAEVNRTINRAAVLSDGAKLYVPIIDEKGSGSTTTPRVVSVNTATAAELEALPGVGMVIAEKIIAGRPYLSLEELVQKSVLSASLLDKCKELLTL